MKKFKDIHEETKEYYKSDESHHDLVADIVHKVNKGRSSRGAFQKISSDNQAKVKAFVKSKHYTTGDHPISAAYKTWHKEVHGK